jgi:hypothetical protein
MHFYKIAMNSAVMEFYWIRILSLKAIGWSEIGFINFNLFVNFNDN